MGRDQIEVLFYINLGKVFLSQIILAFLPALDINDDDSKNSFTHNFDALMLTFKEPNIIRLSTLCFNIGVGMALSSTILIAFYSLILREESEDEQYRLSCIILIVRGIGAFCGGFVDGLIYL